ncbi:MAG TPA: hypothetical protein VGN52_00290 [Burkholderiales bacterium]
MIVLFWNMQRLGSGTPAKRMEMFEGVLAEAFSQIYNCDLAVLCEVVSNAVVSKHANVTVNKQAQIVRRGGAAKQQAQLGYAAIDDDMDDVELEKLTMPSFKEVFGTTAPRKGGNIFAKHSKRSVACVDADGARKLYVYHANASAKAAFLVAWVAESLRQENDGNFVLVGDLNAPPDAVKSALQQFGVDPAKFVFVSDGHTHNAKEGATKTYDYAITGAGLAMKVRKIDIRPVVQVVAKANLLAGAAVSAAAAGGAAAGGAAAAGGGAAAAAAGPTGKQINDETNANMSDHMPIIVEY